MKNLLGKMMSNALIFHFYALIFHFYLIPKMSLACEHCRQVNIVQLYLHSRLILKVYKDEFDDEDRKLGLLSLFSSPVKHF